MIAYDTNILIYALEGISSWSKAAQAIVQSGEHEGAVLSVLIWQELMTGAVMRGDDSDKRLANILNDFSATKFAPVTLSICEKATSLTKHYGKQVYGYDAIHLATAIEFKAEYFVTNDKELLSLELDEVKIISL
jgi:predicted nucleic acid-binding protein